MSADNRATIEQALATFLDAFTQLGRNRVEACFTPDATVFIPFGGKRQRGFWLDRFDTWRTGRPGPPYMSLEPMDLQVQMLGDMVAVVTFHLKLDPQALNRRTLVFTNTADGWKIAHVHASATSWEPSA